MLEIMKIIKKQKKGCNNPFFLIRGNRIKNDRIQTNLYTIIDIMISRKKMKIEKRFMDE